MIRIRIIKASSRYNTGKTIGVFLTFRGRPIAWTAFHRVPGIHGWKRV